MSRVRVPLLAPPILMADVRIAGLVLAGGAARRMGGGDKPLLEVAGRPMLASGDRSAGGLADRHQCQWRPRAFCRLRAAGAAGRARLRAKGRWRDYWRACDGRRRLGMTDLLTAPGDTPFLPADLASRLQPAPCCAASGGRLHHLVALWPVSCATALHATLSAPGSRRVADFAARIGMRCVDFAVPDGDPFVNVNTPDELAEVRALVCRGYGSSAD